MSKLYDCYLIGVQMSILQISKDGHLSIQHVIVVIWMLYAYYWTVEEISKLQIKMVGLQSVQHHIKVMLKLYDYYWTTMLKLTIQMSTVTNLLTWQPML